MDSTSIPDMLIRYIVVIEIVGKMLGFKLITCKFLMVVYFDFEIRDFSFCACCSKLKRFLILCIFFVYQLLEHYRTIISVYELSIPVFEFNLSNNITNYCE